MQNSLTYLTLAKCGQGQCDVNCCFGLGTLPLAFSWQLRSFRAFREAVTQTAVVSRGWLEVSAAFQKASVQPA